MVADSVIISLQYSCVCCSATIYTAELGPGDMLTVPPFWLHHVETLEESVSVNVWSDSPEYATINDMYVMRILSLPCYNYGLFSSYSKPIPFEEEWDLHDRVFALRVYLAIVSTSFHLKHIETILPLK